MGCSSAPFFAPTSHLARLLSLLGPQGWKTEQTVASSQKLCRPGPIDVARSRLPQSPRDGLPSERMLGKCSCLFSVLRSSAALGARPACGVWTYLSRWAPPRRGLWSDVPACPRARGSRAPVLSLEVDGVCGQLGGLMGSGSRGDARVPQVAVCPARGQPGGHLEIAPLSS